AIRSGGPRRGTRWGYEGLGGIRACRRPPLPGRTRGGRHRRRGRLLALDRAPGAGPSGKPPTRAVAGGPVRTACSCQEVSPPMTDSVRSAASLAEAEYQRLADAVRRLEAAWQNGRAGSLVTFLPDVPARLSTRILLELIKVDQDYRWRGGERVLVEEYLQAW